MTANMKIIIIRTTVRLDNAGKVLAMMVKISFSDFQDLASLKTLKSLKDLSIDKPSMPSAKSSTKDKTTMIKSKIFHPSCQNKSRWLKNIFRIAKFLR